MQVRDVLRTKGAAVYSITADETVAESIARMVRHNIGSMPVVDQDLHVVGIFTERDLMRGAHQCCEGFLQRPLREVMTPNPYSCDLDDDVHHVMGVMTQHRVGQLPVLLHGQLVGLVSIGDIVKVLYEKVEAENQHLLAYIQGSV